MGPSIRPQQTGTGAHPSVLADLVDTLIRERLYGFADGTVSDGWYHVDGIRFRVRPGGPLQPWRYADGDVLYGERRVGPDELLRILTGACGTDGAAGQVAGDLRTAVAHATVPAPADDAELVAAARGRPFHPTARAVVGWDAELLARYGRRPFGIDWLAVRTDHLRFGGGSWTPSALPDVPAETEARSDETLVPVHPWQLEHVLATEFADEFAAGAVRVLARETGRWHPTSSLRTLASTEPGRHVKLPLGVNTLGSGRPLPARYLDNGERGERLLRAVLAGDPELAELVTVADETAWCGWDGDPYADRPGLLAAQVRTYPPETVGAIPMGALASAEWYAAHPVDPVPFFRELAADFCAMAVGFLAHGVLPEIHGQNVLRVRRRFVLRDHDAVRYCPAWSDAPDPEYRVKQGGRQSLRLDDPAELTGYLQTLGFQVNLHGVIDALATHHDVDEYRLWAELRHALADALDRRNAPVLRRLLLETPTWPARRVLAPLLRDGRSTGPSMPADTGTVPNPLWTARTT